MKQLNLRQQFKILKRKDRALITPVNPGIWELTLPSLRKTSFAQTSLVLRVGNYFSNLMDNGSVSDGSGFAQATQIKHRLYRLRLRYRLRVIGGKFTVCRFANDSQNLLKAVRRFVEYFVALDRMVRHHIR